MQSNSDAELVGIRGALSHLSGPRDVHHATIVTDSLAAIQMLQGTDWRQSRTSVLSIQ